MTVAEWQAANLAPVRAIARGQRPTSRGVRPLRGMPLPARTARSGGEREAGRAGAGLPLPRHPHRRSLHRAREHQRAQARSVRGGHLAGADGPGGAERPARLRGSAERHREALRGRSGASGVRGGPDASASARQRLSRAAEARAAAVNQAQSELQRALAPAAGGEATESYDDLPIEDRRRILGSSIDAVIVARDDARVPVEERVTILWRGEGPDDLPRRGRDNRPVGPTRRSGRTIALGGKVRQSCESCACLKTGTEAQGADNQQERAVAVER